MTSPSADWDPRVPQVLDDQRQAYDELRRDCPVAHSDALGWSVFRHADVAAVLADHGSYSNDVSQHLSVPNGMDPPEHTVFRAVIEPYFHPMRLVAYAPTFRRIAADLVASLPNGEVEVMDAVGHPFALGVQCAFMGWPERLHEPLGQWIRRSQAATHEQDRDELTALATEFDHHIREQLDERRSAGDAAPDDTTTELLRERVDGRPLTDDELVSLIRNWTVGELGSIAASVGIVAHHLANDRSLQDELRADRSQLVPAIDEMLRLDGPLVANRRRTTREVELGGRRIPAGERVTIIWPSANRDEAVFGDQVFDPDGHAEDNLLYGAGIHVCPGAPLARLELEIVIGELLAGTTSLELAGDAPRARYPAGGFAAVPLAVARGQDRTESP